MQQKPLSKLFKFIFNKVSGAATAVRRRCRTIIHPLLRPLFQWVAERLGFAMVEFHTIRIVEEKVAIERISYSMIQAAYVPDEYIEKTIRREIASQLPIEIYRRRLPHGYYLPEELIEVRGEIYIAKIPRNKRIEN
jgi:hypothetical protein